VLAQNPTATMLGTVQDPSGAVVAGADLEIRNKGTDISRKATTNQRGEFTVPDLAPGPYEVTITHAGFRTVRQTDIVLEMDQVRPGVAAFRRQQNGGSGRIRYLLRRQYPERYPHRPRRRIPLRRYADG
jgi:hypothetical protein